jgi:hypothetical protein
LSEGLIQVVPKEDETCHRFASVFSRAEQR